MLPTRLSPVAVDNQYIVALAAAFHTICCIPDIPSTFYFVIGQRDKRHHSGNATDGMMFTQGRKNSRDWLPAGRRTGQRAATAAGFKNAGGNLKIKPHTPRKFADFTERGFFRSGFASSPWPLSDGPAHRHPESVLVKLYSEALLTPSVPLSNRLRRVSSLSS